jgi:hypothetical protein
MKMISMAKMPMQEMLMVMMWIADHDVGVWKMTMAAMLMILVMTPRHADSQFLTEQPLHPSSPLHFSRL